LSDLIWLCPATRLAPITLEETDADADTEAGTDADAEAEAEAEAETETLNDAESELVAASLEPICQLQSPQSPHGC
jgi:hypothetical protein